MRGPRVFGETTSCSGSLNHTAMRGGGDDAETETSRLEGRSFRGIQCMPGSILVTHKPMESCLVSTGTL